MWTPIYGCTFFGGIGELIHVALEQSAASLQTWAGFSYSPRRIHMSALLVRCESAGLTSCVQAHIYIYIFMAIIDGHVGSYWL